MKDKTTTTTAATAVTPTPDAVSPAVTSSQGTTKRRGLLSNFRGRTTEAPRTTAATEMPAPDKIAVSDLVSLTTHFVPPVY